MDHSHKEAQKTFCAFLWLKIRGQQNAGEMLSTR